MSSVSPASRFHRILKKLSRVETGEVPSWCASFVLSNEEVLGFYRGDSDDDDIIFTNQACLFRDALDNSIRRINHSQISKIEFPVPASESIDLTLHLKDKSTNRIRVVGRENNYRDVFEVGRYFMRIAEDLSAV